MELVHNRLKFFEVRWKARFLIFVFCRLLNILVNISIFKSWEILFSVAGLSAYLLLNLSYQLFPRCQVLRPLFLSTLSFHLDARILSYAVSARPFLSVQ